MNVNDLDIAMESKELKQFLKDALINGFTVQSGFEKFLLYRKGNGFLPECRLAINFKITNVYNPAVNGYLADVTINGDFKETVEISKISIAEILLKNRTKK